MFVKDAKPCRGKCGKMTRKTGGKCNACERLFPAKPRKPRKLPSFDAFGLDDPGPTEEELERTIAEQSKKLPAWWDNSVALAKKDEPRPGIRIIRVRAVDGQVIRRQPFLW